MMNEPAFTSTLIFLEILFSAAVLKTLGSAGGRWPLLTLVGAVLAAWLATMYTLIHWGFFSATGIPQLTFTLAVAIPVILGYAGVRRYSPLREVVDLMTTSDLLRLQYWRAAFGVMFFLTGALPHWFKLVGGLGDIAAGLAAIAALAMYRDRPELERKAIIRGNVVGILDFAIVLTLGAGVVLQNQSPDIAFDLIPLYVVPIFILLHVFSLQRMKMAR